MIHLTPAEYRTMPWANRGGTTTELMREDGPEGTLAWRLSMAVVDGDGPFSHFDGVDRCLTVIDGPGFGLVGPHGRRDAVPMTPLHFPGDIETAAVDVTAPVRDFNVMVDRASFTVAVRVARAPQRVHLAGAVMALFAVEPASFTLGRLGTDMGVHDLVTFEAECEVELGSGVVLAVEIVAREAAAGA